MAEGPVDLGIHNVSMKDEPLTEESTYAQMSNMSARAQNGPVDLGIHKVNLADHYMVVVNNSPVSGALGSQQLAENFIAGLPDEQKRVARIVPATSDGKQPLYG